MHKIVLTLVGLVFILGNVPASGQTPEEEKSFNTTMRLKRLIARVLNEKANPGESSTVFAMVVPGIGFNDKPDGTEGAPNYIPAWVLNTLPATDLSGHTSATNITEMYRRAYYDSTLKNPKTMAQLQKDADDAKTILASLEPLVTAYTNGQLDYATKNSAYLDALTKYGPAAQATMLAKTQRSVSLQLWQVQGKKVEYENIRRGFNQKIFGGSEPWLLWQDRYAQAAGNTTDPDPNGDFGVAVFPAYTDWAKDSGWTTFAFDASHVKSTNTKHSFSASYSGGMRLFGFGGSAGGNYTKSSDVSQDALDSMSFKIEIKRVLTYRSWGDPTVFRSPNWKWKDAAMVDKPENQISQGKYDPQKGMFLGLMPLYPTSLILARNVEITAKFSVADKSNFNSSISGSASGSFLCFKSSGSVESTSSSSLVENSDGTSTIKIPAPQIIGYVCDVLPVCPASSPTTKEADLGGMQPDEF